MPEDHPFIALTEFLLREAAHHQQLPTLSSWAHRAHRCRLAREQPRIRAATAPTTPYSDVSNAEALVPAHGQNLRYCDAWGRWLIWSGTHWRIDDTGEIMWRARATLKALVVRALDAEDRPLVQHLTRSHTHGRLTAMGKQAQSMGTMPLLPAACDTDPWRLNPGSAFCGACWAVPCLRPALTRA